MLRTILSALAVAAIVAAAPARPSLAAAGTTAPTEADALTAASPDILLMVRLARIRGHLRSGEELIIAGDMAAARAQFGEPLQSEAAAISAELKARGLPDAVPLAAELERRADGKSKQAELAKAYGDMLDMVAAGEESIAEEVRGSPAFVSDVVLRLVRSSAAAYAEAYAGGKLADAEAYRSARGYLRQAGELLEAGQSGLTARSAPAAEALTATLGRLTGAIPEIAAPVMPPLPVADLAAAVSELEAAARPLGN